MLSQTYESVSHGDPVPYGETELTTLSNEIKQLENRFNVNCG